jgi:PKHD-type hydroxylase
MLLEIPAVLSPAEVGRFRARLDAARWIDGNVTSGHQSAQAKFNEQLPEESTEARELNRYREGMKFHNHVDGAMRTHPASGVRIRTDLSATLFLSQPSEYDGGELLVEDTYGVQRVKLDAGSLILYPSTSLHRVEPITRGARVASFFWIQSMVRDDGKRSLLFDLDASIMRLTAAHPGDPALVSLVGVYHNLLRMWGEP